MKYAFSLVISLLLAMQATVLTAQTVSSARDTLGQALEQFELLENSAASNTDLVLAEPLYQIAQEYRRLGRFADAHAALDRGMQIVRINGGLYARDQIPYIQKKIENFSDWGDWESSRELLEHLLWLHRTKSTQIDSPLLNDLMELSQFHLRGISEDLPAFQGYHFRRASAANWLAVAAAERIWGRTDRRLVPMLYGLLHQYRLQAIAVEEGGRTGYELREIVPGSDWVRDKSDQIRYSYETGMRILLQVEDIYSLPEQGDAEALAMTQVYKADWQLMFSRNEQALESYEQAFDGLTEAGVPREQVNLYFANTTLLPVREFYPTLADALVARVAEPAIADIGSDTDTEAALYFVEWSVNFPYVRAPYSPQQASIPDNNFALFSFNVAGINEFTRWLSRQTVQEIGVLLDVTLLRSELGSIEDQEDVLRRVQSLDFRPRLVDGQPEDSSATLVYQPAQQLLVPSFQ